MIFLLILVGVDIPLCIVTTLSSNLFPWIKLKKRSFCFICLCDPRSSDLKAKYQNETQSGLQPENSLT